ncbi:fused MFS/spermidine synthase [Paratractidigestivibacter sp.]|uniref:spermidine synthase n=1 Tax=Paratractidigestivibacter sp. TaxID=2847316 RepID=UPI002AC89BF1|nr:fused MFS/spermidine synthase [Paratractidigestivibacter sp.]
MFGNLDLHIVRLGLRPTLVYTVEGPEGEAVRVLSCGGVFQSATYLDKKRMEPVFEYYRAFGRALEGVEAPAPRVLVVGGGGFAVPKHVRELRPEARIDVVEIDVRVIEAARRWFFADGAGARVTCGDGFDFVRGAALRGEKYDFIALDAFSGSAPVASLAGAEAARAYAKLLAPGGVLAANVVTLDGDATFLRDFQLVLEAEFSQVDLMACPDDAWAADDNFLLMARA